MKRTLYIVCAVIGLTAMTSCENFLDTEDLTNKNTSNFPVSENDLQQTLTGVYAVNTYNQGGPGRWMNTFQFPEFIVDYSLPGGGIDDRQSRAFAHFKQYGENNLSEMWRRFYMGIHRANYLFEHVNDVKWTKEEDKNKLLGQNYYLRAGFYFDLIRFFENVPLILTSDVDPATPQADPHDVYQLIFSDYVKAIELMPAVPFKDVPKTDLGRTSKWAAEGMLARAYLFYSGVYGKSEIQLNDGSVLTKQRVIDYVDDCINNSSHNLLSDFRNLWPYSLVNKDYQYAVNNNLNWIGETGDNIETVFAWKYSIYGANNHRNYCNGTNVLYGIRGQNFLPFGQGSGIGVVNPRLYEQWPDEDLRKKGTILNVMDPEEGISYKWNKNRNFIETGLFNKKYIPINVKDANNKLVNYSVVLYGAPQNFALNNTQDIVILRFADILLMGAELGGPQAQSYMDRVRNRVHLPSVPATLENIKKERLYELAYEGVRYYDLMRWGDLEKQINTMKKDVPCKITGKDATYTCTYRPETRGFFPIPEDEILLSKGVLKQNKGWDTPDALYQD